MNNKKWTPAEEEILLRHIAVFPNKKSRCFLMVAQELGRTKNAVVNHWYQHLSKDQEKCSRFGLCEISNTEKISITSKATLLAHNAIKHLKRWCNTFHLPHISISITY